MEFSPNKTPAEIIKRFGGTYFREKEKKKEKEKNPLKNQLRWNCYFSSQDTPNNKIF